LSSHKATTAKTGIAIAPTDGTTVDELLANADLALYQAKSNGGRTRRFFLPVHRAQVQARRALDLELTRAYAQKELEIYFQPEIRLIDGAVVGAESLLRWRHPERGILMPGTFIDTLATNDVALDVGRWIILTACQKAASWRAMGLSPGRIGINVFPPQFQGDLLLKAIDDALPRPICRQKASSSKSPRTVLLIIRALPRRCKSCTKSASALLSTISAPVMRR
jgi:predicted signal transduction protein with EAL and GGDEF domain